MRRFVMFAVALCAASSAGAVTLDLNSPDGIAALYVVGDGPALDTAYFVCVNGDGYTWELGTAGGAWSTFNPSPVPLAEVADWTPWIVRTTDGRIFLRGATADHVSWEQMGVHAGIPPLPPCFVPVGAEVEALGKVKSLYR